MRNPSLLLDSRSLHRSLVVSGLVLLAAIPSGLSLAGCKKAATAPPAAVAAPNPAAPNAAAPTRSTHGLADRVRNEAQQMRKEDNP